MSSVHADCSNRLFLQHPEYSSRIVIALLVVDNLDKTCDDKRNYGQDYKIVLVIISPIYSSQLRRFRYRDREPHKYGGRVSQRINQREGNVLEPQTYVKENRS